MHKSLIPPDRFSGQRNVLSRAEKIRRLQKEGRWAEGSSVFGLPKVKIVRLKAKKKVKEEKEATATGEAPAATEAAGAAKPGGAPKPAAKPAK